MPYLKSHSLKRFLPAVAIALLLTTLGFSPLQHAKALSGSDFNPGNIINNGTFTNSNAMSVADIQNFLNAKVPTCDTNGTQPFSGTTRAAYSRANGHPLPLVCLKGYYENTTNHANNLTVVDGQPVAPPAGSISAAQIIYNAAHDYNINPQVLLVTLQKEQSLVTDDWPWTSQFTKAMGYACPDSSPGCDSTYYGFYNQVTSAAWQFRHYLDNPNNYNYVVGTDYILYSPTAGCGGSNVVIQNQATAALYDYTPYQPNAAALSGVSNSSPGGTVTCGAYGNRNFWWYFNQWFGPSSPNYGAVYAGQSPSPTLKAGQVSASYIQYKNTGNAAWYDDTTASANNASPVHLAITNPINASSSFGWGWTSLSRPATTFGAVYESDGTTLAANQHVVQPGQIAKFSFTITVPYGFTPGTYNTYFQPVLEGSANWNMGGLAWITTTVTPTINAAQYYDQTADPALKAGQASAAYFRYKNTGNTTWYDDTTASANNASPVHLAITNPINASSSFGWGWTSLSRPATTFGAVYESDGTTLAANQHVVQPGQIAKFSFTITVPYGYPSGRYRNYVQPVLESADAWNMGGVGWFDVNVVPTINAAQYAGQAPNPTLHDGEVNSNYLLYKNTGNTTWYDDTTASANNASPVHLAVTNPINSGSSFSWGWPNSGRAAVTFGAVYESDGTTLAANQHVVQPGQIAKFSFTITVPYGYPSGRYNAYFQPVLEGPGNWNMDGIAWTTVTVN